MPKHPRSRRIPLGADNFLSVLEGVEGGFAIFVGIVAGLSFENISRDLLIMTAAIGIIVNAFNASAVRYTSEHYVDELDGREKRRWFRAYFWPSLIEFLSYLTVSTIAILPLVFIEDRLTALWACIGLTMFFLFVAGAYRGWLLRKHMLRDGLEVTFSGLLIIGVGALAGWLLSYFLV